MAIPEGWSVLSIAELVRQSDGTLIDGDWIESKDQSPAGTVRLLQVGNVLRGRLRTAGTARWVTSETVKQLGCTLIALGDILIARMPDPVGRACLIEFLPTPSITAVDCAILRISEQFAHRQYLVQAFNSDAHLAAVQRLLTGTTRQRISRSNLASLPVPLPPLPEQKKIAAILLSVDETIAKTESVIAQLQIVKKAMMEQLLTKGMPGRHTRFKQTEIGEIPEEWEVVLLDSVARRGSGHTPDKGHPEYWDGNIKWVSLKDSSQLDRLHIFDTVAKITPAGIANSSAVEHPPGTVVLLRDASVGRSAIMTDVMAVSQHFMAWKCGARLSNYYLYYWLQHKKPMFEHIAIGSTIKTIGLPFFKQLRLQLPSIEEQEQIANSLKSTDLLLFEEFRVLEEFKKVKSALSSSLLSGEIRVVLEVA